MPLEEPVISTAGASLAEDGDVDIVQTLLIEHAMLLRFYVVGQVANLPESRQVSNLPHEQNKYVFSLPPPVSCLLSPLS
jgi:hypothetical protein